MNTHVGLEWGMTLQYRGFPILEFFLGYKSKRPLITISDVTVAITFYKMLCSKAKLFSTNNEL